MIANGGLPRITVVTPSYQQAAFLEQAILSVLHQGYPDLEYLVMDGGSMDGSVDIIRRYERRLSGWVSERDGGQSAAIAKGFARATGEILVWLNSDDVFCPGALLAVGRHFAEHPDCECLNGGGYFIDEAGRYFRYHKLSFTRGVAAPFARFKWLGAHSIHQPSTFYRRSAYEAVGGVDRHLRFVMDRDLATRMAARRPLCAITRMLSGSRVHGATKSETLQDVSAEESELMMARYGARSAPRWRQALGYWRWRVPGQLQKLGWALRRGLGLQPLPPIVYPPLADPAAPAPRRAKARGKPLRVLALSHSAVVPSYRAKFVRLAERRGWDLHLALPDAWPEGGAPVAAPAPGPEGRLRVHVLPGRLNGRVGFATLADLGALADALKPALVYAEEEPYSLGAYAALRAARGVGAAFAAYTWENIDRAYKPPLNWVRGRVLAGAAGMVAGNREGAGLLRGWGFLGPLLVQPQYGITAAEFKPVRSARRPFTVGYFGRLVPEKGVATLVAACARAGLRLRIGGQGPQERELRALAGRLKADVSFLGFVPFAQRRSFYASVDALALPSVGTAGWKEQFGRVLAEAMACGLPCLGSDSGAIPEVIGPGGLVLPEADVEPWAAALKRLARSAPLRRRLGAAGRRHALAHFEEGVLADGLGRFLEGLAG